MSVPLRLEFDVTGDLLSAVRDCEVDVLGHWYGDTRESLRAAYGDHEAQTVFLALVHHLEGVVGFARIIRPGPRGLKTLQDIGQPPWSIDGPRSFDAAGLDLATTWDIATLGVRRELRGAGQVASAALYYGVLNTALANGMSSVVAIIDSRARSLLNALGLILNALPGTAAASYMGSPACAPVYAHLAEMLDYQRQASPDAHRLISMGIGLDGVATPSREDFLLPERPGWSAAGLGVA